jgi:hypothetical protein
LLVGRAADLKAQRAILVEVIVSRDEAVSAGAVRLVESAAFEIAMVAAELHALGVDRDAQAFLFLVRAAASGAALRAGSVIAANRGARRMQSEPF